MHGEVYRSLRWMTGAKLLTQAVSWASTIMVMRWLAPTDYGLVAMAGVFSGFLLYLGDFGLGTALISRKETDPEVLRAAHGVSLLGGAALFLTMVAVAPLIGRFFASPALVPLVQCGSLLFLVIGASTVPRALLAMQMRFREVSIVGLVSSLIATGTTLFLAWFGYGAWSLVVGTVAGGISKALHLNWYAGRLPRPTLALARLRGLLRLSWYLVATSAAYYWYEQVDALIVGRKLGDATLGYLSAGKSLAFMPVSKVAEVTNQVALPAFAQMQYDLSGTAEAYSKAVRLSLIVSFPALWGLAVTAPDVVEVLLGSKWNQAILVIQLLSCVAPLRLASSFAGVALQGIGRPDLAFAYTLKSLILSVVLLLFGVNWGLAGVSIVWAFSISTVFLLGLGAVASCMPIVRRQIAKELMLAAVPALVMAASVLAAQLMLEGVSAVVRLGVSSLLGALIWFVSIQALSAAQFRELLDVARRFRGS